MNSSRPHCGSPGRSSSAAPSTYDFDQHSPDYAQRAMEIEGELRANHPVAWCSSYGGFWAVAGHAELRRCLREQELVSSAKTYDEEGCPAGGVNIPPVGAYHVLPAESDPPEWNDYRSVLNPVLSPAAVNRMRPLLEGYATAVVNNVIERGEADFISEIGYPLTALVTLHLIGLPAEDYEFYSEVFHRLPWDRYSPETQAHAAEVQRRLQSAIETHRDEPGDLLLGRLIAARPRDRQLTDLEMVNVLFQVLGGGFETTATLLGNAISYLSDHPEIHGRLINDDGFLMTATEEFLRWASPTVAQARTARIDFELGGQQIRAGDRLWLMFRSTNRDERAFDNPDEVNLERSPNQHHAFGGGLHRCVGSNLARAEFQIMLREVLMRMPDISIQRDKVRRFPSRAVIDGWIALPVRFTPGIRHPVDQDAQVALTHS